MDEGSKPLAIIYHIYYRLLKTNLNPHARLKNTSDKTLLIQCSTPNAKVQIPRMIHWKYITLSKEWLLEREAQPAKFAFDELNLDHIQQYLDGTAKINFGNSKPLMINEGRYSFVGSTASENISKQDQDLNDYRRILKNLI